ncbi:MAG: eukaryotic-like serine/threonine-protein kinase [Acidobacteriota bacterium]|jgi:TonB family protein|nr:eukaryotic-like serine/threonine-protein kinase [Acidobacteriota bacterium]
MPENILVVEYEPRYTDRVRQALEGQPFVPSFAKDGEEAMKVLDSEAPRLIVLSSVVPKVSTSELIRAIRASTRLASTPILLTVSGYNGKSPKADAVRMGASDILPKPYSESEFLGKIQQMLGIRGDAANARQWTPELDPEFTVRPTPAPNAGGQLTSNEIFGELLEDDRAPSSGARKAMKPTDDLDKMLADTLAGVRPSQKKKDAAPAPAAPRPAEPSAAAAPPPASVRPMDNKADNKPKTQGSEFDRMLNDTLSGLEKNARPRTAPVPAPAPPPAAPRPAAAAPNPSPSRYNTDKMPAYNPEKVAQSQPVFPQAAVQPLTAPFEDEESADGTKFGQYVMLDRIATGGMAEVWKARMRGVEGFQKIVAIKKILPHLSDNQDFIEMFVDEAKLAAQLNHNNIIHIYDLGKIQSSYYIAMEYIDGHDLKTILRRGEERDQPMQVELALFIASKIAAALDYAHRKHDFEGKDLGLVHRDVSPQNVLISQEGDIKLCDFGIAKAASKASHTQAGALKGKLQYMSPEQAWGRHIDKRSDIFALATVLFEMLTGRKLFTGDNELSILEQVREARINSPSEINDEVTPEIDKIVLKALQKDPEKRYQTAGEMAKDLDAVLYSFRPTPTSADLAIYMHRIWNEEPASIEMPQHHHEPEPIHDPKELRPVVKPAAVAPAPVPVAAPTPVMPPFEPAQSYSSVIDEAPPQKKAPVVPIAIAAVVVMALIGAWFMMRKPSAAPAPVAPAQTASSATQTVGTQAPTTSAATSTLVPAGTATTATLDPAQINAEVQKRIAAEKARLEQQARAQQTTTAAIVAQQQPARPTPAPVAAAPAPAPVQPSAPAPQPVAPQVVETPRPAPQPVAEAPAAATVRAGDIVAAGTEGLTPPRRTSSPALQYPLMARQQRVEGSVLLSVLVSETGKVLDVRVIRGVNRAVGINEAAEQQVRRSSFTPGNKDGVPVKVWIPVTIDFKL